MSARPFSPVAFREQMLYGESFYIEVAPSNDGAPELSAKPGEIITLVKDGKDWPVEVIEIEGRRIHFRPIERH